MMLMKMTIYAAKSVTYYILEIKVNEMTLFKKTEMKKEMSAQIVQHPNKN